MIRIDTKGNGYEEIQIRTRDGIERLQHHRVLAYAWGNLDSPLFADDAREIHHQSGIEWDNRESNLDALSPEEHRAVDPGRSRIRTPWESPV